MEITNAATARAFVNAWSGSGPTRKRWIFTQAAGDMAACAAISHSNGSTIAAKHYEEARAVLLAAAPALPLAA